MTLDTLRSSAGGFTFHAARLDRIAGLVLWTGFLLLLVVNSR